MNIVTIPLDQIDVGDRLRAVDEDRARLISLSMEESGQHTPIMVRAAKAGAARKWLLVAGGHRYRAAEIIQAETIDATVFRGSPLEARLAEIDENLIRHELSALDRAVFLAERQEVYEKLNPGSRKQARLKQGDAAPRSAHMAERAFTDDAAERLGWSTRSIQRAVKLARAIPADVRQTISGTWLAGHGGELDFLARLKPAVQRQVVALMRDRGATTIRHLRDEVQGIRAPVTDPETEQYEALWKAWRKATAPARRRFQAAVAKNQTADVREDAQ